MTQIRVNGYIYVVPKVPDHLKVEVCGAVYYSSLAQTHEQTMANLANLVLTDGAEEHGIALTLLANSGWTHLSREILGDYCAANGLDDCLAA